MASTIKRVLCVALLSATAILAASSGDERSAGRAQVVGLAQHESRRLEREAWNDDRGAVESCGACCFVVASNDGSLDPFYGKVVDVAGFKVASSSAVRDTALLEAAYTLARMARDRPDLVATLSPRRRRSRRRRRRPSPRRRRRPSPRRRRSPCRRQSRRPSPRTNASLTAHAV